MQRNLSIKFNINGNMINTSYINDNFQNIRNVLTLLLIVNKYKLEH